MNESKQILFLRSLYGNGVILCISGESSQIDVPLIQVIKIGSTIAAFNLGDLIL